MSPATTALSRQYAKLCDVDDFRDPRLLAAIRTLLPERDAEQHIERKVWEYAMVTLFLEELGYFNASSEILSVGAGDERVLFWLTNHVGRMIATDIYGEGHFDSQEAAPSMLTDPAAHLPSPDYPWRPERLDVRWMDARHLDLPDESVDAVFSISSIEHFGLPSQISAAAAEIGRVLRPGGHAMIVTEFLIRTDPRDRILSKFAIRLGSLNPRRVARPRRWGARGEAFTAPELGRRIIEPSGLTLMQPLDLSISSRSWDNVATSFADGTLSFHTGHRYPLVMMRVGHSEFTSVCLPLVKPFR